MTPVQAMGTGGLDYTPYGDQFSPALPIIPADYVCHAFPDDTSPTDGYFVALISIAVCYPVTGILTQMFDASNDIEMPEGWQEQPESKWQRLLLGGPDPVRGWNWHYDEKCGYEAGGEREAPNAAGGAPSGEEEGEAIEALSVFGRKKPVNAAYYWMLMNGETPALMLVIGWVLQLWNAVRGGGENEDDGEGGGEKAEVKEGGEETHEEADKEYEEALKAVRKARLLAGLGVGGILICWVLMSWFILVYGLIIYNLLGQQAEQVRPPSCRT